MSAEVKESVNLELEALERRIREMEARLGEKEGN